MSAVVERVRGSCGDEADASADHRARRSMLVALHRLHRRHRQTADARPASPALPRHSARVRLDHSLYSQHSPFYRLF